MPKQVISGFHSADYYSGIRTIKHDQNLLIEGFDRVVRTNTYCTYLLPISQLSLQECELIQSPMLFALVAEQNLPEEGLIM